MTTTERPGFWAKIKDDPATAALMDSVKSFATAQAGNVASKATDKISGKEGTGDGVGGAVQGVADAASDGKGKVGTLWGGVKGAVKGLFKGGKGGSSSKRPTNIVEDVWIGAPVDVVYEKWTRFEDWAGFTKGVEKVNEENAKNREKAKESNDGGAQDDAKDSGGSDAGQDDAKDSGGSDAGQDEDEQVLNWTARIFWSRRSWKSHTTVNEENRVIRWNSEGNKGVIEGVVTFTPVGENATLVLVVIEYRGKGLIEWFGNRWRTVGRRVRLDLKHFRRFVMLAAADEGSFGQQDESDEQDEPDDQTPDQSDGQDEGDQEGEQDDQDDYEQDEQDDSEPDDEPEPAPVRKRQKVNA